MRFSITKSMGFGEARERLHPAKEPTNGDVCREKKTSNCLFLDACFCNTVSSHIKFSYFLDFVPFVGKSILVFRRWFCDFSIINSPFEFIVKEFMGFWFVKRNSAIRRFVFKIFFRLVNPLFLWYKQIGRLTRLLLWLIVQRLLPIFLKNKNQDQ